MRFTSAAIVLAAATAVSATYGYSNDTVVYTTEIVDVYTTVCPAGATITYGGHTYTNTETVSSTITITDCPCTVSKPVYTATSVYCNTCTAAPTPVYPTGSNSTTPAPTGEAAGTTYVSTPEASTTPITPASGANKAFAMSGSLIGLLGLAAYLL